MFAFLLAAALAVPTPSPTISPLPAGVVQWYARRGADASGLDVSLVRAVIDAESGGDPDAVSKAGAAGLMQLQPDTASDCGLRDRFDAEGNVVCGARTLGYLVHRYGVWQGIAAYNFGAGNVTASGDHLSKMPPETQNYVKTVIDRYDALQHAPVETQPPWTAFPRAAARQSWDGALTNLCAMDPLIITCAPVGAEIALGDTPHLPHTPELLGKTARAVREAGGSIVHVHCRNDDGSNTHDVARFRQAYEQIRASSDLIVQFSTGGAIGMTPQERASVLQLRPEMATLTCGSVNFGDEIFENSFPIMRGILEKMHEFEVRPELEIFDKGHLANARRLAKEGLLTFPQHVDLVLGVPGGLEATVQNLCDLVDDLPPGCTWSVAGIGRAQIAMALAAIAMGGHVRVGLEDNLYYAKGVLARNEDLVARVARISEEAGRPVATPDQAREILGLRKLTPA